jgi:thioredoxin reductase
MAPRTEVMEMVTDVLVLGGGPAATWAGVAAAESGASVILVGKGMSGQAAQRRRPIPAHGRLRRVSGEAAYRFQPELLALAKYPNVAVKATGQPGAC